MLLQKVCPMLKDKKKESDKAKALLEADAKVKKLSWMKPTNSHTIHLKMS